MATARRPEKPSAVPANPIPSSSPAFGTPVHPIHPRRTAPIRAPPALAPKSKSTVLPILLPPATLRPLAFRTFTKKHNLTLTSAALQALATFIGKHCGSGWREEGLAEKVLEEVAKSWKKCGGQVIVEGDRDVFKGILRALEGAMEGGRVSQGSSLGKQSSFSAGPEQNALPTRPALDAASGFGASSLEVQDKDQDDEEGLLKDPREWIRVIGAFEQPKQIYNVSQRHFEKSASKPSLFPSPSHKTELFRQRYHIVHQRILRNETFQTPTFSTARSATRDRTGSIATSQTNAITPIANLLGRTGSTHLLLGMLVVAPTGALSLSDLTGTIALDMQHARPIPENGAYFAPGMIVLVDGSYEDDHGASSSNLGGTGGIGGTIGGRFLAFSIGHPPCERRTATLGGTGDLDKSSLQGPAFGWTDFLGVGSQRATGSRMARIAANLLTSTAPHNIVIASDLHLDTPSTLTALRTLLRTYSPSAATPNPVYPLAIILMGNFSSKATLAGVPGAGSIEYKEHFDALASVLSEFQPLIAHTSLVFVPGDNDAWPSAFSAGAAAPLPRKPVPSLFTNRIRRVVAEANREVWGSGRARGKEGEVVWTSNPSRLSWFGVKGEMAILRDDLAGRLHRTSIRFPKPQPGEDDDEMPFAPIHDVNEAMDIDLPPPQAVQPHPEPPVDTDTQTARALTRTILSQSHLSPFPLSARPLHWDLAHSLGLYPLPTSLVLADAEAPAFVVKYCGCTVMNPGPVDVSRGTKGREGRSRWVEFDVRTNSGVVRNEG
ncbi:DNA polymeras-like protein epsilon subunit B [Macroventuria anomochaeta]|uniref:DNA polymeras-like protein epsilon subunit B n=1 Tax=Macroventuria anomochaeta TaxID=301207 RepID=A0ACB6RT36_9PLEO|nr:DNA polymeras-like protein epsilon subunit B [Macroventuria anomochaeta]KAF2625140.1 DNA polymeras-like protein epsilon subunit B [Macroventuria anomochaeta]